MFWFWWFFAGFLMHVISYLSWRSLKSNDEEYEKFLKKSGKTRETDPLNRTGPLIGSMIIYMLFGWITVAWMVVTLIRGNDYQI